MVNVAQTVMELNCGGKVVRSTFQWSCCVRATLISSADSLVGLGQCGVDLKQSLLRALTELYVQKASHTLEEERQFIELALRLIDTVDAATRAETARLLAAYPGAPLDILQRLTADPAGSLDEASRHSDQESPPHSASAPDSAGTHDCADAVAITQRFFAAAPAQRVALLAQFDTQVPLEPATLRPSANTASVLETSALAGRPGDLIRELESALGIVRPLAEAIVNDRSGEPLVVAAKALALPIDVLQRILLFVNPSIGHSVRRVYALSALFDQISSAAALRLVAAWRKAGGVPMRRRSPASPPAPRPLLAGAPPRNVQPAHAQSPGGAPSTDDPVEKVAS